MAIFPELSPLTPLLKMAKKRERESKHKRSSGAARAAAPPRPVRHLRPANTIHYPGGRPLHPAYQRAEQNRHDTRPAPIPAARHGARYEMPAYGQPRVPLDEEDMTESTESSERTRHAPPASESESSYSESGSESTYSESRSSSGSSTRSVLHLPPPRPPAGPARSAPMMPMAPPPLPPSAPRRNGVPNAPQAREQNRPPGRRRLRAKNWIFTSYSDERPEIGLGIDYICSQREICPRTNRHHWQGYIEFAQQVDESEVRSLLGPGAFVQIRYGPQQAAINYTKKPESAIPNTWLEQGRPHDLPVGEMWATVKESIENGATYPDIARSAPRLAFQYASGIKSVIDALNEPPEWRDVKCFLYWGQSGAGKTRRVKEQEGYLNVYIKPPGPWWDGYNGQPVVLLDEFSGETPFQDLLRWTDGHPLRVPFKGGFKAALWNKVYFTSNIPRDAWYPNMCTARMDALRRRLPDNHCFYMVKPEVEGDRGEIHEPPPMIMHNGVPVIVAPPPVPTTNDASEDDEPRPDAPPVSLSALMDAVNRATTPDTVAGSEANLEDLSKSTMARRFPIIPHSA